MKKEDPHSSGLKQVFLERSPDWLFAVILNFYWRLHPKRENILLIPRSDSWLIVREDGSRIFSPKSRRLPFVEPYERYFGIRLDETVLDIGACIGDFAIPAAKKAKEVIAIEANPENAAWLRRNVAKNGLQNVRIVEKAVWNCKKVLRLYLARGNIGGHSVVGDGGAGSIKAQADTLDNIVSDLGVEKVDFVKIDVEGAEVHVLEGAKKVLTMAKKIVMETHLGINGEMTTFKVQSILKNCGFEVWVKPHFNLGMVYGEKRSGEVMK